MLTREQIEKIKQVRRMDSDEPILFLNHKSEVKESKVSGGYGYIYAKRALEETGWDVQKALKLLMDNNQYGTFIAR